MEIIKQYITNINSSFDQNMQIKSDSISKEQFIRVNELIEEELKMVIQNPYYLKLTFNYPKLTVIQVHISRETAQLKNQNDFALNRELILLVIELYHLVKKDLKKICFTAGPLYSLDQQLLNLETFLKSKN